MQGIAPSRVDAVKGEVQAMSIETIVEGVVLLLNGIGLISFGWWRVWFNNCSLRRVFTGVCLVFAGGLSLAVGFVMLFS